MKKYLLRFLIFTGIGVIAAPIMAQHTPSSALKVSRRMLSTNIPNEQGSVTSGRNVYAGMHSNPLPTSITPPPGTDMLPISGTFPFQSNARPLHNFQIDPSNPLKMHALIMATIDQTDADTGTNQLFTRRMFYTYSSDGGKTWTNPSYFSASDRTGYADMQLMHRGDQWVPIIAAHRVPGSLGGSNTLTGIWIEKGNEGDGKFSENLADDNTQEGSSGSIIWPTLAVSPDGKTAYVLASVNSTTALSQLQFGTFTLVNDEGTPSPFGDSAIFNGWSAEPGAGDQNQPNAGHSVGGPYRIRVSPSGKLGAFWQNGDNGDNSLYFSESTDAGKTWSTTINQLVPLDYRAPNVGSNWTPTGSMDFWYDGENPKFYFVGYEVQGTTQYFPYTTALYFWNPSQSDTAIMVSQASLDPTQPRIIPNTMNITTGSVLNPQGLHITWPAVARTADSNVFAMFYQTLIQGDTEVLVDPDADTNVVYAYASIYYSRTVDGGKTWSDPSVFKGNSSEGQKYDFRAPQTSDFNPIGANGVDYHAIFDIDTAAGWMIRNGLPGFDVIYHGHADITTSGVNDHQNLIAPTLTLNQNYPNPTNQQTTIGFVLKDESNVLLTVEDMLGRPVATIVNGRLGAGDHLVVFNTENLSSGVYRYTLHAEGESVTKNMSLLK